jgi:hypothetical protein
MSAFVRRFTSVPSLEVLLEIEAVNIVDLAPPDPSTGTGSGAVLVVGEWEDGPFAAGGDAADFVSDDRTGPVEVFGSSDLVSTFGGFGFVRGTLPSQDPCCRRRNGELWNGNGFIKARYLRASRLMVARVDSSVGSVSFSPLASIDTGIGPYGLTVGQQLSVESNGAAPASTTAIAAAAAQVTGAAGTYPTLFAGGEALSIALDGAAPVTVTFLAADQLLADVIARINATMGATIASNSAGQLRLTGVREGTGGSIVIANVSGTPLATLGLTAGTTAGTGNVADLSAVTAAELATIFNASAIAGFTARALADGSLRLRATVSLGVAAGTLATALGVEIVGTTIAAGTHGGGRIPAGTRVTNGTTSFLTMQTLTLADGSTGPHAVKVRPTTDDGAGLGATGGTVTTITDQPDFADFTVNNPSALSTPRTEAGMDVAYEAAFNATTALDKPTAQANYTLSARRTDAVVRAGRQNAIDASAQGCFGRVFITRSPLGSTPATILANVASYRSDRVFYTGPGWRVRIPEIAAVGTAGGLGFTADGVITRASDTELATLCAVLPPEENPAQDTEGLIDHCLAVEDTGVSMTIEVYKAFKAGGVCAPKIDLDSGPTFQSGVTSSLESGRTTQARRRFADFIQNTLAVIGKPYSKKLNRRAERDSLFGRVDSFLSGLQNVRDEKASRLESYSLDDGPNVNAPTSLALGIYRIRTVVRQYSSLDAIVFETEIGPNAQPTTTEL